MGLDDWLGEAGLGVLREASLRDARLFILQEKGLAHVGLFVLNETVAVLSNAVLRNAILRNAILKNAILKHAVLKDTGLIILQGVQLRDVERFVLEDTVGLRATSVPVRDAGFYVLQEVTRLEDALLLILEGIGRLRDAMLFIFEEMLGLKHGELIVLEGKLRRRNGWLDRAIVAAEQLINAGRGEAIPRDEDASSGGMRFGHEPRRKRHWGSGATLETVRRRECLKRRVVVGLPVVRRCSSTVEMTELAVVDGIKARQAEIGESRALHHG